MSKKNNPRVLLLAALFFTTAFPCHAETVLERAKKVDDPELGACIRFALERYRERFTGGEDQQLELIRKVTELFTEIKLHDKQIRHIEVQLGQPDGPDTLRHELILAQAELESKRELAFAQLRQVLYIVPRHHMGEIPTEQLKSHLTVDVVDSGTVWVYDTSIDRRSPGFTFLEKISPKAVPECARRILALAKQTPARIQILSYSPHSKIASALHGQLRDAISQKRLGLDVDLRLTVYPRKGRRATLLIVDGQIVTGSRSSRSGRKVATSWDPSDSNRLDDELRGHLDPNKGPGRQPTTLHIEYCEDSKEVAEMIAERAKAMVKELGMESRATIELEPAKTTWIK